MIRRVREGVRVQGRRGELVLVRADAHAPDPPPRAVVEARDVVGGRAGGGSVGVETTPARREGGAVARDRRRAGAAPPRPGRPPRGPTPSEDPREPGRGRRGARPGGDVARDDIASDAEDATRGDRSD